MQHSALEARVMVNSISNSPSTRNFNLYSSHHKLRFRTPRRSKSSWRDGRTKMIFVRPAWKWAVLLRPKYISTLSPFLPSSLSFILEFHAQSIRSKIVSSFVKVRRIYDSRLNSWQHSHLPNFSRASGLSLITFSYRTFPLIFRQAISYLFLPNTHTQPRHHISHPHKTNHLRTQTPLSTPLPFASSAQHEQWRLWLSSRFPSWRLQRLSRMGCGDGESGSIGGMVTGRVMHGIDVKWSGGKGKAGVIDKWIAGWSIGGERY